MYKYTHAENSERKTTVTAFKGLCTNGNAGAGEFTALSGFCTDFHPSLHTRKKHRIGEEITGGTPTFFRSDKTGYITAEGTLIYGEDEIENFCEELEEGESREIVMLGAIATVFPDKKWYNTSSGETGSMEIHKTLPVTSGNTVTLTLKFDDGTSPDSYYYRATEPTSPSDGMLWCSKQQDGSILAQRYFGTGECWIPQDEIQYCFTSTGAGSDIYEGDYVTVSDITADGRTITKLDGEHRVTDVTTDSVTISAKPEIWLCAHVCRENPHSYNISGISFDRTVPDFDYICACDNRLWACSKDGHEIRSSALGAPCSWERFDGNEMDSWAVEIGSTGKFTGCGVWDTCPVFFKENEIIRICGNKPSNFGISSVICTGVQSGCGKSVCSLNGSLYYKGADGVYRWAGSNPVKVSRNVNISSSGCFASALGDGYYLAVPDGEGKCDIFIYDSTLGIWHSERELNIESLFSNGCELYGIVPEDEDGNAGIISLDRLGSGSNIDGIDFTDEANVSWLATTSNLLDSMERRSIRQLDFECSASKGSVVSVSGYFDCSANPVTLGFVYGDGKRRVCSLSVPCEDVSDFKVCFSGKGEFALHGIGIISSKVEEGIWHG